MRFVAISDTHGRHTDLVLPEGDVLIHAGDVTRRGSRAEVVEFLDWFGGLDYRHKIFIAGNHDAFFETASRDRIRSVLPDGVEYLQNSACEVGGLHIWGSPFTPYFHDMAFNYRIDPSNRELWAGIPNDTDILVTHGPARGILDRTFFFKKAGCPYLLERVKEVQPKIHLCGHIHEAYGEREVDGIRFINASTLNILFRPVNKPVVFDL